MLSQDPSADDRKSEVNPGRRRLLITGLAAAPFILTLAATPAHGAPGMGSLGSYLGDYDDGDNIADQGLQPESPQDEATESRFSSGSRDW